MTRHEMKLRPLPYGQIASGKKTVEARLYDEKRRLVELGDTIAFTNTDTNEMIKARVVGLLRYGSFEDMFTHQSPRVFGFDDSESSEAAAAMMRQYYSEAEEVQYGVLGIQIQPVLQ